MHGTKVSEEELDAFIDMSHAGGAVEEDEKRQIKNLLNLSDMNAGSVMTPRVNVEFLSLDMTIDEACDFLMKSSHSRLPVCGETTDDVEFVITFREAFQLQREGHGSAHLSSLDLEKIMKVSLTQALDDLFEKFQKSRSVASIFAFFNLTGGRGSFRLEVRFFKNYPLIGQFAHGENTLPVILVGGIGKKFIGMGDEPVGIN